MKRPTGTASGSSRPAASSVGANLIGLTGSVAFFSQIMLHDNALAPY